MTAGGKRATGLASDSLHGPGGSFLMAAPRFGPSFLSCSFHTFFLMFVLLGFQVI